ncbi:MAG: DUF2252 family protein [Gemmatimonadota bacterium]
MWRTRRSYDSPYQPPEAEVGDEAGGLEGANSPDTTESPPAATTPTRVFQTRKNEVPLAGPVERIREFNTGREPERLQIKYARMRSDIFAFFRGTSHLFYDDWPAGNLLDRTPTVWATGDLHMENFGSFKANNRLVYFDLIDFDDAGLAPAGWELTRFVTSVIVGARDLGVGGRETIGLTQLFLRSYGAALKEGKARWVERPTAKGMVKDLLTELKSRSRRELLDSRTEINGRARRLRIDMKRTLPVPEVARGRIAAFMKKWAARQPDPEFFQLLDVARRIAGVSSLGLPRYALLVEGNGSPHRNFLLDLKMANPSAMISRGTTSQPQWKNDADRIVAIQQRMQSVSPALHHPVLVNRQPYVIAELQPTQDRLLLTRWGGKIRRLEKVMTAMGETVAWAELRSGGRNGSAIPDDLINFANSDGWQHEVVGYARFYASKVESDYKEFSRAYDAGELGGA